MRNSSGSPTSSNARPTGQAASRPPGNPDVASPARTWRAGQRTHHQVWRRCTATRTTRTAPQPTGDEEIRIPVVDRRLSRDGLRRGGIAVRRRWPVRRVAASPRYGLVAPPRPCGAILRWDQLSVKWSESDSPWSGIRARTTAEVGMVGTGFVDRRVSDRGVVAGECDGASTRKRRVLPWPGPATSHC